jgi:hypothetical protein
LEIERENALDSFSMVEIMFEFSKAIRHSLIAIECLNDLNGVDQPKVTALADSVRRAHADVTGCLVKLIPVPSTRSAAGE